MGETQQMQGGSSSSGTGSGEGGKQELPWKAYAKVEAKHHQWRMHPINGECIPVMVRVSGVREKRGPMDVVVVLHVRRGIDNNLNAPKNWRELLKQAMDTVAASLHDEDRLAVVPGASTLTPARTFQPPQIENFSPAMDRDTSLVTALELAESILLGREHEQKMRRAGHIIVISNSNDGMGSLVPYRHRYVRHAFGFRDAHNTRTMQRLCSSIRNCTYSVLDDEQGQIAPAFFASIDRTITSAVAAVPTEVKLKCEQKVLVAAIDTPGVRHFISYDKKVALVWPPAHLAAEPFKFVVYLANLPLRCSDDDLHRLFSIQAKYKYGGGGDGGDVSSSPPVHKVAVRVVTRQKNVRESKEVAAEMVRTQAVKIVADMLAIDKMDWEQLHRAAEYLREKWKKLKETDDCYKEVAAGDDDGVICGLSADIYEMEMRLFNNYFWQEYMLSWHSHQRWQLPIPRSFMDKQPTRNQHLLVVDPVVVPSPAGEARGEEGLLPVLVRVMASEVGLAMEKRAPVDLVVMVDAGYGAKEMEETLEKRRKLLSKAKDLEEQHNYAKQMDEEIERVKYRARKRLDVITTAIELVQKKLSAKDRLAIICAQFPDTEPAAGLLKMSTRGQWLTNAKLKKFMGKLMELSEASRKIPMPKLYKASSSHCREQSKKAMKLIRTCLNCTLNSSTPIPTSAEGQYKLASMTVNSGDAGGSTPLSKALIHAVEILDERREQENDHRMGFIIVISDRDDDSIFGKTISHKYITHAFGFHETHKMWAMYHIARSCNGIYDILNDESYKLTEAFVACINKITSIIAVDTNIHIKCRHSNVVSSAIESSSNLFGSYWASIGDSGKSCSIKAGALSAGTVANFIINMDQVHEDELFTVHIEWEHPLGKTKEKPEDEVVVRKQGGVDIDRPKGMGVLAASVAQHVEVVKIVNDIVAPLYQDRMMVEDNLKQKCQKCSMDAKDATEDHLARVMKKMADNLHMETGNPPYFKQLVAQTLSFMLSWLSYQRPIQQAP